MIEDNKLLPTGKPHVSFSEVKTWKECPWRHKLLYIDKVQEYEDSEHTVFGTIVHGMCEEYLKTKVINKELLEKKLRESWQSKNYNDVDTWLKNAELIMNDLPQFMTDNFGDWDCVDAELALYEPIGDSQYSFKGFVDGIISVKHKKKDIIWIIDWKSANARGWTSEKRRDFTVQAQLALYKFYLMQKLTLDAKEVKCSFILLKKGAKPGKICERIDVSAGPKTLEKSQKFISNAISGMNSKIILKNKLSCKFCQFKNTKHCPGSGDF